jgi:hypothetical protein
MNFYSLESTTTTDMDAWPAGSSLKVLSTTSVGYGKATAFWFDSRGSSYYLQTMSIYVHCIDKKCGLVTLQMFSPMQVRAHYSVRT